MQRKLVVRLEKEAVLCMYIIGFEVLFDAAFLRREKETELQEL